MPTEAQVQTSIADAVRIFEHLDRYVNTNTQNFSDHKDTLAASVGPNTFLFDDDIFSAAARFRAGLVSTIQQGRNILTPLLRDYGRVLDFPETDIATILSRLLDDFRDRGLTVASRQFVFGAIAAATANAGDGVINRLTVDENSDDIENTFAESKEAEVVADEHSGSSEHEERFEFRGQALGEDSLDLRGSGRVAIIKSLSAADSLEFLQNPSFSDSNVGALTTADTIPGWTIQSGSPTDFRIDDATTGQVFRGFEGDTVPKSLKFLADAVIFQGFDNRRIQLTPQIPMYLQLAFRPDTATAGVLTLTMGAVSRAVVITTALGGVFNILRINISADNWFKNFNQENPNITINLTGANGSVWVDDVVFARYQPFNSIWYAPVGGATPFLRDDIFSWTHTNGDRVAGTQGLVQHWLWRIFNAYLPHTTTTPSFIDPAV